METSEILKRVREVEIKTKGLSHNIFAGEYQTAFKGKGMTFSEVREYQYGDDIRNIDWNVTARFNQPYVKLFEEERELTVMLLIDISGSRNFGTSDKFKRNVIAEIAAVLSFSAILNNDKIGMILFSDQIEKYIPPQKGKKHILYIIRELIGFKPKSKETNISEALKYFTNATKKRCTAFLISDFFDENFEQDLLIANKKHDVIALQVYDDREANLPDIGLMKIRDAETAATRWVDTSSKKIRNYYSEYWKKNQEELKNIFNKSRVDYVSIKTDDDYVKSLMTLFKMRA